MTNRPSIAEVFDLMVKDAKEKPPFLNMRKHLDKEMRDNISGMIMEATAAVKPYILNDKQIGEIYVNFEFEWQIIDTICKDIIIYFKIEKYIDDLFKKWIKAASEIEEYEIANNIKKVKILIDQKRCLKNNI